MNHPYLYLFRRSINWLRRSINFLWLFFVAAYLVVLAGHAFYRNYQAQQETKSLQHQLADAKLEREKLDALLVYYNTDSFKEKELRRTLLLKRPDEKAYVLPESSTVRRPEEDLATASTQTANQKTSTLPIWQQWVQFVWNGDKG